MTTSAMTALIGGTGLERLPSDFQVAEIVIETPFGSAKAQRAQRGAESFLFLSRHGAGHDIPPHRIDYRANIAALVAWGVRRVFATNAVGSLRADLPPGSLVLLNDFIDFTRGRLRSYWDGAEGAPAPVVHTDFSEPYCPELRTALLTAAREIGIEIVPQGVYLCTEGPRFESPAEVRLFGQWGADVVGMTGLPEAVFAREAGLCYAAVAIVTNYGAGLTTETVTHEENVLRMADRAEAVRNLLMAAARGVPVVRGCGCGRKGG